MKTRVQFPGPLQRCQSGVWHTHKIQHWEGSPELTDQLVLCNSLATGQGESLSLRRWREFGRIKAKIVLLPPQTHGHTCKPTCTYIHICTYTRMKAHVHSAYMRNGNIIRSLVFIRLVMKVRQLLTDYSIRMMGQG